MISPNTIHFQLPATWFCKSNPWIFPFLNLSTNLANSFQHSLHCYIECIFKVLQFRSWIPINHLWDQLYYFLSHGRYFCRWDLKQPLSDADSRFSYHLFWYVNRIR
ncbi:unnamed protein product [Linum tenue]|uniref:Uncharacterized protein n=1 Tax=Linum tenue TaxID=586396 RepID=A0AAV0LEP8_9ROSI|nr:unnamed protein product [Linum tenue]